MRVLWFVSGMFAGFVMLSIAFGSVPQRGQITDDTAIYQNLSEIRVPRAAVPDFDHDISRLSSLEPRYREKLPTLAENPRLQGPMHRISQKPYQYSNRTSGKKVSR